MMKKKIAKRLWKAKVSVLACVVVATVFGASTAMAANGGNFILAANNTATAASFLTGTVAGSSPLIISNPSTAAGSTALDLRVTAGKAPLKVNSTAKVTNLNADTVDGQDSTALLPGGNLPPDRTVRGTYDIRGTVPESGSGGGLGYDSSAISFGYHLAKTPTVQFVRAGQPSTTECPGTVGFPEAVRGYLCIYESAHDNVYNSAYYPYNDFVTQDGANVIAYSGNPRVANQTDSFYTKGTWAVTGPCPGVLTKQC